MTTLRTFTVSLQKNGERSLELPRELVEALGGDTFEITVVGSLAVMQPMPATFGEIEIDPEPLSAGTAASLKRSEAEYKAGSGRSLNSFVALRNPDAD